MRHLPLIVATVILTLVLIFTRAINPQPASAAPTMDDAARTAHQFTPWLTALVHGKPQNADQYFHLRPAAQNEMANSDTSQILSRLSQVDNFDLNLVWSKSLGEGTGIAMFTIATTDGPIGFKVYYYTFANQPFVSHVDFTSHWSEIERMAFTVDQLSAPVATVPLNDQ